MADVNRIYVSLPFTVRLDISFPGAGEAKIAYDVLRVNKEPPRSDVSKSLNLENKILNVCFTAATLNKLRIGVSSFLDQLILLCDVMIGFGQHIGSNNSPYI